MFEFTYNDNELFENLKFQSRIHPDSEYDFTFENRFLIYHYPALHKHLYVAYDKQTGYGSEVCRSKAKIKKAEYHSMMKDILYSIKYKQGILSLPYHCPGPRCLTQNVVRPRIPETSRVSGTFRTISQGAISMLSNNTIQYFRGNEPNPLTFKGRVNMAFFFDAVAVTV